MSLSRRDVLRAFASVGVVGCTASAPDPAPADQPPPPPRERLADGPPAEHLLIVDSGGMYGSNHLTVYADGLALFYRRRISEWTRRPPTQILRLEPLEIRDLKAIFSSPEFTGAAPHYTKTSFKDGGLTKFVAGARKIGVHGGAKEVPPVLEWLQRTSEELELRIDERGQDAYRAAEPRLLVVYERWHRATSTSDQLIVWANGTLDYRVLRSSTPFDREKDSHDPVVRLEQATPADVAELTALLAGGSFTTAQSISHVEGDGATSGTAHFIYHTGPTMEVAPGFDPPAGIRPVVVALARLLERFGAPPDEPNVMPPGKAR